MVKNVILIVAGEPNSIFEILFKSLKNINQRKAIILIGCKRI